MLQALSMTESPRAIPLLLAQPGRHRSGGAPPERGSPRQRTLDRLLVPPVVALAGVPNVGKSTLINRLAGREVAITADQAGTTRDAVVARVALDGLACEVVDLPGRREEGDEIERESIRLSERFIEEADLLVLVTDERDLAPENLSRTLEDSGTVTSVLIPWNTCGVAQSGILGVATWAYLPYCIFNWVSPLMTMTVAAVGFRIKRLSDVKAN